LKLSESVRPWDERKMTSFFDAAREADQPSSTLFGKMPPLRGSNDEIERLKEYLGNR